MSEASNFIIEDEAAILEDDDDDSGQHVKLDEEDEMLLLSSPSSGKEEDSSSQPVGKPGEGKSVPKSVEQSISSDKIVVEDSESEEEVENTDNSVEVIDSEEESLSEGDEDEEEDEDGEEEIEDVESSSAYLDGKVQIFLLHGSLFIWNADDVRMLREECRIIGKLSGCLPRAPCQNIQLGLPLQLMPEEAKLLEEIEAACVVEEMEVSDEDERLRKTAFDQTRRENFKIQQKLYKESRKEQIVQHMDEIIAGKKAKKRKIRELTKNEKSPKLDSVVSDTLDKVDEVLDSKDEGGSKNQDEMKGKSDSPTRADVPHGSDSKSQASVKDSISIEKGETTMDESNSRDQGGNIERSKADESKEDSALVQSDISEEGVLDVDDMVVGETDVQHSLVQIFTDNPWHRDVRRCKNWVFPLSQKDRLRYAVFRDLWRKGYYLTSGCKFGGDFLVYPGDPARFHSHYIAICVDVNEDMSALDMVFIARLASNVRKTALLCSYNKFRQVSYLSLQWPGMI